MAKKESTGKYPVVEVVWTDAIEHGDIGWNDLPELKKLARKPCPTVRSVGYCVYHGPKHIALLSTVGSDECSRLDKIPSEFVQTITYLRGMPPKTLPGGPLPPKNLSEL